MLDPVQILLIIVITILTSALTLISLEIFKALKELRQSLTTLNKILQDINRVSSSVVEPVESSCEFLTGLKKGVNIFKTISSLFKDKNNEE